MGTKWTGPTISWENGMGSRASIRLGGITARENNLELPTLLRIMGVGSVDLEAFTGSGKVIVGVRPEHVIIFNAETGKTITHGI